MIAPYATAMALMVAPVEACENLQRLAAEGRAGAYGFYEAVDYTPSRLPPDETSATIRSFMAHHQGMSLLALVNLLRDYPMQRRFMACPLLKAADLLLQERVPKTAASVFVEDLNLEDIADAVRRGRKRDARFHESHPAGAGGSSFVQRPLSCRHQQRRRRLQPLARSGGHPLARGCHARLLGNVCLSARSGHGGFLVHRLSTHLAARRKATKPFSRRRARSSGRRHAGLEIHTEISVSPEDDVELRRITITNRSSVARVIELTSYAEVVLALPAADAAHPAFSNLFVQTEFARKSSAILCTRRARSQEEKPPWLLHLMVGQGGEQGEISCETDRSRFVGRGGTLANPAAMQGRSPLSNTVGSVLDPIISLRRTVSLPPHETAIIDLVLGVTESREAALAQVEKYQSSRMADRAFDLAWTHSQVTLRQLNATEAEAQLYGRLASALIYADPARRANPGVLRNNRRGQSGLWSYGISGDAPHRPAPHQRHGEDRDRPAADPGALLLAHEGADG